MASAMPVLPLVGSTRTVSLLMTPAFSADSIIEKPMRSFTLWAGLKNSSLATTSAPSPSVTRFRRTSGVLPIRSVTLLAIFMINTPRVVSSSRRLVLRQSRRISPFGTFRFTNEKTADCVPEYLRQGKRGINAKAVRGRLGGIAGPGPPSAAVSRLLESQRRWFSDPAGYRCNAGWRSYVLLSELTWLLLR